jgi:hypothetical protein
LKPITVSKLMDNAVEVAEGISTIDRVVNNPSAALIEGDKVRVVTPAPGYDLINTVTPSPQSAQPAQDPQPAQTSQPSQTSQPTQLPELQVPPSPQTPPPAPLRQPPQALQPIQP